MANDVPSSSSNEISVETDNQTYLVRRDGSELSIGRRSGETVLWQNETVPVDQLPDPAREALEAGKTDDPDLQGALRAVVQAFVERGG